MNKNKDNTRSDLPAADSKLKKRPSEKILVFLVLALSILTVQLLFIHSSFFNEHVPSGAQKEVYFWAAGTTELDEGLYLITQQQLTETFPKMLPLFSEATAGPAANPPVTAVRYGSDVARRVDLPPEVANIFFQPIPINKADKEILSSLPGIGQVLAERIVQRRKEYGPFMSKNELLHVSGIGPKKFARLVDHVTIE